MTQTKYIPSDGLIQVQEGTKITVGSSGPIIMKDSIFVANGINGPADAISFSTDIITALNFGVLKEVIWITGYYIWSAGGNPAGPTGPVKFALWSQTSETFGSLVPNSSVTAETLVPGWNLIPLEIPVPISPNSPYIIACGINANFVDILNQFGSGGPYIDGIGSPNGFLFAWSDADLGDINRAPLGNPQGLFTTDGSDPTTTFPAEGSDSFWPGLDIEIDNETPKNYVGTFRLWPNSGTVLNWIIDSPANFVLATEFAVDKAVTVHNVWFYSGPGIDQLPTSVDVWEIPSKEHILSNASPDWSGAAGTGWISTPLSGSLPKGKYYVSVYNGGDVAAINVETNSYWTTGGGQNGITMGPLSAPNFTDGTEAFEYDSSGESNTPPWTDGTGETVNAQSVFAVGPPNQYPYLTVNEDPFTGETFYVDIEVS